MFCHLELDGSRLTDLAVAARITKPSMRALIERAETLRLVERAGDPADGRARIVRFTSTGIAMLEDLRRGVAKAEEDFARATESGARDAGKLALTAYITAAAAG